MSSPYIRLGMPTRATVATLALGAVAWATACGGKAVIDGPTGSGGEGGSSPTATTSSLPTTSTTEPPPTSTSTATTTTVSECESACATIWDCAQQDDLCPGLDPSMGEVFVPSCVEACAQTPALIAIVDPDDCAWTVQTIAQVSPDFAAMCYGTD